MTTCKADDDSWGGEGVSFAFCFSDWVPGICGTHAQSAELMLFILGQAIPSRSSLELHFAAEINGGATCAGHGQAGEGGAELGTLRHLHLSRASGFGSILQVLLGLRQLGRRLVLADVRQPLLLRGVVVLVLQGELTPDGGEQHPLNEAGPTLFGNHRLSLGGGDPGGNQNVGQNYEDEGAHGASPAVSIGCRSMGPQTRYRLVRLNHNGILAKRAWALYPSARIGFQDRTRHNTTKKQFCQ